jgi:vacuolar protein sorting-associated protein 26
VSLAQVKRLLYTEGDTVSGKVLVNLKDKRLEHGGIKVEFVGLIELFYDRGNHYEFTSQIVELAPAGVLAKSASFDYAFNEVRAAPSAMRPCARGARLTRSAQVQMPYESYNGINARLRYFIRATISKRFGDIVHEKDVWVHKFANLPEINHSIKMEVRACVRIHVRPSRDACNVRWHAGAQVGIEGALHIEFEYNRSKYTLRDVIVGKIYFLLVRIKIQRMEVSIIKRESTGTGANTYNESETVTKFEIMDGSPVRGECIPVRLFLNGFELTPTYKDINKKFSVRYYLNLVLIDQVARGGTRATHTHTYTQTHAHAAADDGLRAL